MHDIYLKEPLIGQVSCRWRRCFLLSTVTIRVGIGTPGFTGAALFILSALLAAGVLRLSLMEASEPNTG